METALRATGLPNIYQLTKHFGRHAFDPTIGETLGEWAASRSKLYGAWRAGTAFLCKQDGRLSSAAIDFVSSLKDDASAAVKATLDWKLWRLLDPEPVPPTLPDNMLRQGAFRLDWPSIYMAEAWRPKAILKHATEIAKLVADPATRLEAIEWLWLTIRMTRYIDELPLYVLCYGIWLNAEPVVRTDPILGRLSAGLYAHAERHFAQVMLVPGEAESLTEAFSVLWDTNMPLCFEDGDTKRCLVIDKVLCEQLLGMFVPEDYRRATMWPGATKWSGVVRRTPTPQH